MPVRPRDEISIAVVGATGSGKSTFINLVSGSKLDVSNRLKSCTQEIQLANKFILNGHVVQLLDTPGLDDTSRSEVEILGTISKFLATSYKAGVVLHGILYFHRVSNNRMGGAATRSFKLFREICGDRFLKNAAIVTTMWDRVSLEEAVPREEELRTDPRFFKPLLDKQAQLLRHDNTLESARNIIRALLPNRPIPLGIQVELIEERKHISDTAAGKNVASELDKMSNKLREDAEFLKEMMETDNLPAQEVEDILGELDKSNAKLAQVRDELHALKEGYHLTYGAIQDEPILQSLAQIPDNKPIEHPWSVIAKKPESRSPQEETLIKSAKLGRKLTKSPPDKSIPEQVYCCNIQ